MFWPRAERERRHQAAIPTTRRASPGAPTWVVMWFQLRVLLYVSAMGVLMGNARASLVAAASVLLTLYCAAPASSHGTKQVSRELKEQGFEQLEFQRTKPPFKLDACRDGQRYHLHVDYYGKLTEQTLLGPCDGEDTKAPAEEAAVEDKPTDFPKPTSRASGGDKTSPKTAAREL